MAPVKITETHMDSRNQGPQNGGIDNGLGSYTYPVYKNLDPSTLTEGKVVKFNLVLTANALETVNVPVLAYRSRKAGPTVGITCAIHGNEINGIPVIQKLFEDINNNSLELLSGTVIGVPVVNVPGFLASIRQFDDESKQDLNRLMPGYDILFYMGFCLVVWIYVLLTRTKNNDIGSKPEQRLNNTLMQYSTRSSAVLTTLSTFIQHLPVGKILSMFELT